MDPPTGELWPSFSPKLAETWACNVGFAVGLVARTNNISWLDVAPRDDASIAAAARSTLTSYAAGARGQRGERTTA